MQVTGTCLQLWVTDILGFEEAALKRQLGAVQQVIALGLQDRYSSLLVAFACYRWTSLQQQGRCCRHSFRRPFVSHSEGSELA